MQILGRDHERLRPGGTEGPSGERAEQALALLVRTDRRGRIALARRQFQKRSD